MKRLLLEISGAPETVRVSGPRFHHLVHVLRAGEGETLEVFDGTGRAFTARVSSLEADAATLSLTELREVARTREWILLQGLPKADKLELILQKTTELGVTRVIPLALERSIVKLAPEKIADRRIRWARIAEEAARQCGRNDVPEVDALRGLDEALQSLPPDTAVFVLDEEETAVRLGAAYATNVPPGRAVALLVGPEGGISREEVARAKARGAMTVSLGDRILRTETAGLAALAVLQHRDGALG